MKTLVLSILLLSGCTPTGRQSFAEVMAQGFQGAGRQAQYYPAYRQAYQPRYLNCSTVGGYTNCTSY